MADIDENDDEDNLSFGLYGSCDWTKPRSWLVLLGLGIATGSFCGLLCGIISVYVFGRLVVAIDGELLAAIAEMTLIVVSLLFVLWAIASAAFALRDQWDPDRAGTARWFDRSRAYAILASLQATIVIPFVAAVMMFIDYEQPAENRAASFILMAIICAGVIIGPRVVRAGLERWCPPAPIRFD